MSARFPHAVASPNVYYWYLLLVFTLFHLHGLFLLFLLLLGFAGRRGIVLLHGFVEVREVGEVAGAGVVDHLEVDAHQDAEGGEDAVVL